MEGLTTLGPRVVQSLRKGPRKTCQKTFRFCAKTSW